MNKVRLLLSILALKISLQAGLTNAFGLSDWGHGMVRAAMENNLSTLEEGLARYGAAADEDDGYGRAPLFWATYFGHLEIAKRLLQAKANPNRITCDGQTLLHLAFENKSDDILKLLLQNGANPNQPNKEGERPLDLAIAFDHLPTIELLLKSGAHPNAADPIDGMTPFLKALEKGASNEVISLLLAHGAKVKAHAFNNRRIITTILSLRDAKLLQQLAEGGAFSEVDLSTLLPQFRAYSSDNCKIAQYLDSQRDNLGRSHPWTRILEHTFGPLQEVCQNKQREFLSTLENSNFETNIGEALETAPLEIAVHAGYVMARAKDGHVMKIGSSIEKSLENAFYKARGLYSYMARSLGHEKDTKASTSFILNIYLSPGHAFVSIDGPNQSIPVGFYPGGGRIANNHRTEDTIGTALYATTFGLFYALINTPLHFTPYKDNHYLKTLLPAVLAAMASRELYGAIYPVMDHIDHKIGNIVDEFEAQYIAEKNHHLKVSFLITHEQAEDVKAYIDSVRENCKNQSPKKCTYHVLTRNCLTFAQEVFNAAGFKGNVFDYFSAEALSQVDYSSFNSFYDTKALFYANLSSKGIRGSDSFVEVEV